MRRFAVSGVTFAIALVAVAALTASADVVPSPEPAPPNAPASAAPAASPSAAASPAPSARPVAAGFATPAACDNAGFIALQAQPGDGYREVTVCGNVVQVLPEKITATGRHKYFSIALDAGGDTIEIATDVEITGEFDVRVGALANVHGRYHRDSIGSQRIDWTNHIVAPSEWAYPGYVQLDGGPLID
jgi:hypothetical protein